MSTYKKINKQTGEVALLYIVYGGDVDILHNDIVNFHFVDCDLYDWEYSTHVKIFNEITYIAIMYTYENEHALEFCTHISTGDAIMPFYFWNNEIQFDESRTYTPDELEAAYPSELYDTVEVEE